MLEIPIGPHKLSLYASAEETPIGRYSRFQKYTLIESGIGSDMEAISNHFAKLHQLLANGLTAEALTEAKNLHYNFHLAIEEINVSSMAFCCLVHSIDGKELTDLTEGHLQEVVLPELSAMGLTQETVKHWAEHVKKKSLMS